MARIEITYRAKPRKNNVASTVFFNEVDPAHRRPQCPYGRAERPMSVIAPPSDPRGERGISMFLVVVAMLLTSMFVVAGFAAAGSDFKTSAGSKSRKGAYAAAEAGLAYYVKQLRTNPDFWTQCDAADAPRTPPRPARSTSSTTAAPTTRKWRKLPSISAEYTIELLHTPKFDKCDRDKQESLVDMSNGTFKVRVTGREYNGATTGAKRSLIATFKRSGFLKFVYFTDQENRDPQADANASNRATQQTNCVNRKRTARKDRGCVEIQFTDNDAINGPLHTNDESLLVCASPRFGREKLKDGSPGMTDSIEVSGAGSRLRRQRRLRHVAEDLHPQRPTSSPSTPRRWTCPSPTRSSSRSPPPAARCTRAGRSSISRTT